MVVVFFYFEFRFKIEGVDDEFFLSFVYFVNIEVDVVIFDGFGKIFCVLVSVMRVLFFYIYVDGGENLVV